MDSKIEAELRFQIAALDKRVKDLERELSDTKESVQTLRHDLLATVKAMAPDD